MKTAPENSPQLPAGYDVSLLFSVLFLVGIGIVMIYSASYALALKKFGSGYFFLRKQGLFALLGIVALVTCRHFPYRYWRYANYPLLVLVLAALIAVTFSDFGLSAGGSTRWLRIGSFSFQPSELARLALVIYLAYSLQKKQERIKSFTIGFLPHVLVLFIFCGLIMMQPDFGSAAMLAAITWFMLFVGGVRLAHLASALVLLVPLSVALMMGAQYRMRRILSFLDPWRYSTDEGYQVVHSLMAFGTGGIWGTGIGKGYQKLFYLPEPHTDFIFSVIGEELGLIGVLLIVGLYFLILWRGIQIARHTPDLFASFLAFGITSALGLQVFVNMGVTLGILPTKGLTLPFLSYGGTSLLLNMAAVGILMNIRASNGKTG